MQGSMKARWDFTMTSDASGLWHICRQGIVFSCSGHSHGMLFISWSRNLYGVAVWARQWAGKTVRCRCDNTATVAIVHSGRSNVERAIIACSS